MFGRIYSERVGLLAAVAVFLGFVLTFLPQFLLGNVGMPRRYYSYPRAVPVAARPLDRRRVPARRGALLLDARSTCSSRSRWGTPRRAEPVGLAQLRVADRRRRRPSTTSPRRRSSTAARTTTTLTEEEAHARTLARLSSSQDLDKQAHAARFGMWVFLGQRGPALRRALRALRGLPRHVPGRVRGRAPRTTTWPSARSTRYVLLTAASPSRWALHAVRGRPPAPGRRAPPGDGARLGVVFLGPQGHRVLRSTSTRGSSPAPATTSRAAGAAAPTSSSRSTYGAPGSTASTSRGHRGARSGSPPAPPRAATRRPTGRGRARRPLLAPRRPRVDLPLAALYLAHR